MALQLFKIADVTVATPQASITFSSIPSGYTDLIVLFSHRCVSGNALSSYLSLNGLGANGLRVLNADGGTVYSGTSVGYYTNGSGYTTNTFSSTQIYIPNYTSSNNKSVSIENVVENNASACVTLISSAIFNITSAISSLALSADANFAAGSTATLYGVL